MIWGIIIFTLFLTITIGSAILADMYVKSALIKWIIIILSGALCGYVGGTIVSKVRDYLEEES